MSLPTTGFVNLPDELKQLNQWAIAGSDGKDSLKAPYTVDSKGVLLHVSVHNQLLPFSIACQAADHYSAQTGGIGFVLKDSDPYTCIDLDYKEGKTTVAQLERYNKIIEAFNSYTEVSVSGKGVHIWVRGNIGQGCRRDGIEVYSQERFIVCTGNMLYDKPIEERQDLLDILVSEIRNNEDKTATFMLKDREERWSDSEVVGMAAHAANADKFNALCRGEWEDLGYPSQSEADLALMSMLAFYSPSNEQCRRLFRMSGLGKREKATKNDRHLDYCLKIVRSRQELDMRVDEQTKQMAKAVAASHRNEFVVPDNVATIEPAQPHARGLAEPAPVVADDPQSKLDWPPGVTGEIAKYIYNTAPRPVREVAIVAAIGFLAGVLGKAYHIPQSGLNVFMILIGKSGVGKEALHSGPASIVGQIRAVVPCVSKFVDFSEFVSGPALIKACAKNSSFVNISGEFGRTRLKRMSIDASESAIATLRTAMTNLYQKSGPGAVVGGLSYSNNEKDVSSISGVAYSLVGETTPGTLYESLTESMLEDGFLSRFTMVEYTGDRAKRNKALSSDMPSELLEKLCDIVVQAETLLSRFTSQLVTYSDEAQDILDAFDLKCDDEINSTQEEGWRQMWTRAHLKVLRIASLLAVADNHIAPVVQLHHAQWAMSLINADIRTISLRIKSGDVGRGDSVRERKIMCVIGDYLKEGAPLSYNIPRKMIDEGVIPRRFIQLRVGRLAQFMDHRGGAVLAMDLALRSLCDSGYLAEIPNAKMPAEYGAQGKCYRIISAPRIN